MLLYNRVMSPNDADGMANSVDPDRTAPLGAQAYTVSVRKRRTITVHSYGYGNFIAMRKKTAAKIN